MKDKVINVDFSKNNRKNKSSFYSSIKNIFKRIFSSADEDLQEQNKKIIRYTHYIS